MKGQRCAGAGVGKKIEDYDNARKNQVNRNILTNDRLRPVKFLEDNLEDSLEDSSLLSFTFGRQKTSDQQEKEASGMSKVDQKPGRIMERMDRMLVKPVEVKDAARTARSDRLSQVRSPGLGGRMKMKKFRCTPKKQITKISQVSTMKHYFESLMASSSTRGPVELLSQSTVKTNLNLQVSATTTGDAENGRKICVSQLEGLKRTGPRQAASLNFSLSQDWSSQTWDGVESQ